jgi:ATP-dependent helicase YprA (DUF1998 family)
VVGAVRAPPTRGAWAAANPIPVRRAPTDDHRLKRLAPAHARSPVLPPATRWLASAFAAPTRAQLGAWPAIAAGEHTLLVAPTGSGKTLAAFLAGMG